ncbi:6-pyruvoyltetrahydropterin/6-carboxytetrahydropterin synthase [Fodinibius salinus]|uniref:6-carboxy-5,6,7,8-tetrahydropterin synthase n=1 Tax=Fodinibius salinus TaxID=860790 RepID=A0A5D3YNX2_9BACT|nr:6-carboxytetrahydropterin synthase [Fodinibius salinus]TYP95574.1 6-pyruvoyltetrahydropterin/6-carboxytetrahydropterin synthase [Fodinibius salinus]
MVFVTRKAHFNAAHRLHNPDKSDQWNKEKFGKCNHENWHGHNYIIKVTVAGIPDSESGYVIDLSELKDIIQLHIIEKCDHKNLNLDVDFLDGIMPSTENLVKAFFEQIEIPIREATDENGFLYEVELEETERNSAKYCPYLLDKEVPVKS